MVVSKQGQGFGKIQDAVNSVGKRSSTTRVCIYPGTYVEQVHIMPGQNNIQFIGAGTGSTQIVAGNQQSRTGNPYYAATLVVEGDHFSATGFTVLNTAVSTGDPSPAVAVLGTKSQWRGVNIESWVDTLAVFTGQHLFADGYISGLTDMVWGFGRIAVVNTNINIRRVNSNIIYIGSLTAMGTDWPTGSLGTGGAIFDGCTINGPGFAYLGRPYRPTSLVVYNNVYMGSPIVKQGWSDWHGRASGGHVTFVEYNSKGPGSGSHSLSSVRSGSPPSEWQWANFIRYPF